MRPPSGGFGGAYRDIFDSEYYYQAEPNTTSSLMFSIIVNNTTTESLDNGYFEAGILATGASYYTSPVPLPASAPLLLGGLGLLGFSAKKKSAKV